MLTFRNEFATQDPRLLHSRTDESKFWWTKELLMLSVLAAHKIRKIVLQIARAARVAALIACQRWMIRDCASSRLHELLAVWLCLMSPDAFDPQARSRPTYDIVSPLKSLYWHFLSRFGLRHENRSSPFGGTLHNRNLIYGHRASDVVQQKSFKSGIIICRFQCLKKTQE